MEYEKIKQLMDDMGNSKLTAIEIEFPDGTKINMKKEAKEEKVVINSELPVAEVSASTSIVDEEKHTENITEAKGNIVTSPMVGTFYTKPSPTSNPYVEIGKEVKVDETLCIIEAMKLMNEIESEYAGKITEIFVKDGEPVEYGTPLFRVE